MNGWNKTRNNNMLFHANHKPHRTLILFLIQEARSAMNESIANVS